MKDLLATLQQTDYELYQAVVKPTHLATLLPKEVRALGAAKLIGCKLSPKGIGILAAYKASNQAMVANLSYQLLVKYKESVQVEPFHYPPVSEVVQVTQVVNNFEIDYPHIRPLPRQDKLQGFDLPSIACKLSSYQVIKPITPVRQLALKLEFSSCNPIDIGLTIDWTKPRHPIPTTRSKYHPPAGCP